MSRLFSSIIARPASRRMLAAALALVLAFGAARLDAQISITPTRVIVSSSKRSGEVLVVNPLDQPMVITARVMFMVLRNDSSGAVVYDSVPRGDARTCAEWISLFPRQFTMEPGSKRKVRIMINAPDSIADGEYMARLEVAGLPVNRPASAGDDTSSVRPKVSVRMALNVPVVYRKGALVAGIELDVVRARPSDSALRVSVALKPGGNSIYRGTLFSTIRDGSGRDVAASETQFVAEVPYVYPLDFPKLAPGSYTLSIESRTERKGTAAEAVIHAPPTKGEYRLKVEAAAVEIGALH
jgi:P pilus assembly chaperone PapD